jgi:hypothetical protein
MKAEPRFVVRNLLRLPFIPLWRFNAYCLLDNGCLVSKSYMNSVAVHSVPCVANTFLHEI